MFVKMNRATRIDGNPVKVGETVEVSAQDGRFLVNAGHAEEADAPAPKKAKPKKTANKMADKEFTRGE